MNDNQVSETKEFVKDLAGSTVEVGTSLVIENLPEFGAEVAGIIGNEAIGATIQTLTGGLLGAVAPSLLGVKLSFQQKRFERNMIKMVTSLREKQEIIEQRMNQLNPEVQQKFISGPYRDIKNQCPVRRNCLLKFFPFHLCLLIFLGNSDSFFGQLICDWLLEHRRCLYLRLRL